MSSLFKMTAHERARHKMLPRNSSLRRAIAFNLKFYRSLVAFEFRAAVPANIERMKVHRWANVLRYWPIVRDDDGISMLEITAIILLLAMLAHVDCCLPPHYVMSPDNMTMPKRHRHTAVPVAGDVCVSHLLKDVCWQPSLYLFAPRYQSQNGG